MQELHLASNNAVMRHVMSPDAGVLLLAAGWLLLCLEFCQPGTYLPGSLGVIAISLGGYAVAILLRAKLMQTIHFFTIGGVIATIFITAKLLHIAWLARRNKFQLVDETPV